jgi:hypothetical protein
MEYLNRSSSHHNQDKKMELRCQQGKNQDYKNKKATKRQNFKDKK